MIEIANYLQALYDAVDGIADKRYVADRPTAVDEKVKTFIIVDIPGFINNKELDRTGSFGYYTTTATIDLFVRDKMTSQRVGMLDVMAMDGLLKKVLGLFPIMDEARGVYVSNPRVIISSSDDNGFHYSSIQARLTTYF